MHALLLNHLPAGLILHFYGFLTHVHRYGPVVEGFGESEHGEDNQDEQNHGESQGNQHLSTKIGVKEARDTPDRQGNYYKGEQKCHLLLSLQIVPREHLSIVVRSSVLRLQCLHERAHSEVLEIGLCVVQLDLHVINGLNVGQQAVLIPCLHLQVLASVFINQTVSQGKSLGRGSREEDQGSHSGTQEKCTSDGNHLYSVVPGLLGWLSYNRLVSSAVSLGDSQEENPEDEEDADDGDILEETATFGRSVEIVVFLEGEDLGVFRGNVQDEAVFELGESFDLALQSLVDLLLFRVLVDNKPLEVDFVEDPVSSRGFVDVVGREDR